MALGMVQLPVTRSIAVTTTATDTRHAEPGLLATILPGILLTAAIAGSAFALHDVPGVAAFSPMILAIAIGIAFHNLIGTPRRARAGVAFSLRRILRFAIILLGLQLTAEQVVSVGPSGLAVILTTLFATFTFTKWLGRMLGIEPKLVELIAAGTSICGASAVVATNTVTDAPDEDVAYAVACVTVFGSIAMFVYPMLPGLLHLTPHSFGLWAGSSIHEIAQVVAASYQDGKLSGDFATIAKLSRVMMLAPVVIGLGFAARAGAARDTAARDGAGRARCRCPGSCSASSRWSASTAWSPCRPRSRPRSSRPPPSCCRWPWPRWGSKPISGNCAPRGSNRSFSARPPFFSSPDLV